MKKVKLSLLIEGREKCNLEGEIENNKKLDYSKKVKWKKEIMGDISFRKVTMTNTNNISDAYQRLIEIANEEYSNKTYKITLDVK